MLSIGKWMTAGAMAAFFTAAWAQQGPCADDVAKLCKDVQPGEGRVLQCLKSNQSAVSAKCASFLKQVKQAKAACESDIERFCSDTPVGKGGIAKCLKKHSAELSPDCKAAVSKAKGAAKQ
jgi:Golgi apparatus protein 1